MWTWLERYKGASPQTKYFILNCVLYGLLIIASTLFCYGRLDYVRSYRKASPQQPVSETPVHNPK